jgi:hypothetical protein
MSAAVRFDCDDCKDMGWIRQGLYAERPFSGTIILILNWLPCEKCHAALSKPRPESMDVRHVKAVPHGTKLRALPPRTGCHLCKGRGHTVVEVPVGAGTVECQLPCLSCDTILTWPMCERPTAGIKFDFDKDLTEASYAPRRRNPRI